MIVGTRSRTPHGLARYLIRTSSACLLAAGMCVAEIVVYPGPGDLSGCDNLRRLTRYEVTVNGERAFV